MDVLGYTKRLSERGKREITKYIYIGLDHVGTKDRRLENSSRAGIIKGHATSCREYCITPREYVLPCAISVCNRDEGRWMV